MYELPPSENLVLETSHDLVSHLFRLCIRSLLASNKILTEHQLEAKFVKYSTKPFLSAAQLCHVEDNYDLSGLLASFPPFHACIAGHAQEKHQVDHSWSLFPTSKIASSDQLLALLSSGRESLNAALITSARLQSNDDKVSFLDLVQAKIFLISAKSVWHYTTAFNACFPPPTLSGKNLSTVDLYNGGMTYILQDTRNSERLGLNEDARPMSKSPSWKDSLALEQFRAYRFQKSFRKSQRSLLSSTYANHVDPMKILCPFELNGICNDEKCNYQHERDYLMSHRDAYLELTRKLGSEDNEDTDSVEPLEYETMASNVVENIHASGGSTLELLVTKQISSPQFVVKSKELVMQKQVQEFCAFTESLSTLRKTPSYFSLDFLIEDEVVVPAKSPNGTFVPKEKTASLLIEQSDDDFLALPPSDDSGLPKINQIGRYHAKDCTLNYIQDLEAEVKQNPEDVDAWISLALLQLDIDLPNIDDVGLISYQCQVLEIIQVLRSKIYCRLLEELNWDKALHILARALEVEANLYNETLWLLYLTLYPENSQRELAGEAVRFLPSSIKLWLYLTSSTKFESVSVANVVYGRAIEKIIKHATQETSRSVALLVQEWCQMLLDAGQVMKAQELMASLLEGGDDKPACLGSFEFATDDLAILWLSYVDVCVFHSCEAFKTSNVFDFIYSTKSICAMVKDGLKHLDRTKFDSIFQGMKTSIGDIHQAVGIFLHNRLVIESCHGNFEMDTILSTLSDFPLPARLRFSLVLTLSSLEKKDVANIWMQDMGIEDLESLLYRCVFNKDQVKRIVETVFKQSLHDSQWAVAQFIQWTESLKEEPNVFLGLVLLHCIAHIDGIAKATKYLDWILDRSFAWSNIYEADHRHLWSLRVEWAVQECNDGDKVLRRYIKRIDTPQNFQSIVSAVDWCLTTPSRKFAFELFSRYVASLPENVHASAYSSFAKDFALFPPFVLAYSNCPFSSDRERFAFKHTLRTCLAGYPSHAGLLRTAVLVELQSPLQNKFTIDRLKALLKAATATNPIASSPFELALSVDMAIGKSKLTLAQVDKIVQATRQRGILFSYPPGHTTVKRLSKSSCRLIQIPPSLFMMPTLLELDLSRNCLLSIPDALFKTLVNLQILDLSYNSLLQLPDSIIGLKMLRQLNILHNSLVELPLLIGQLQELEEINLGFNVFTGVPSTFSALKKLRRVNAKGTHLTVDLLRRSITWPCSIELEHENSPTVILQEKLGSCAICHKNAGKTQRFNDVVLCPKCILVSLLPLL
ncbi:unnamed protein product [Aphanomyces euteiches]